jgi:NTP pyrophosphatase (non-canonical NTP hydrolase)
MSVEFNKYQELAKRTARSGNNEQLNYVLGVNGEAGEIADMIKKNVFHGHMLKVDDLAKEIGDVLWYLANLSTLYGLELSEVAEMNLEKLEKRYPNGFSRVDSIKRVDEA